MAGQAGSSCHSISTDLHVCDVFNTFSGPVRHSIITQRVKADLKLIYSLSLAGGFCLGCLK